MMDLKIPIGVSDFKDLREQGYYYVDKSLCIREVLNRSAKVLLLPRPRRFGKTLNISMLRYFFERAEDEQAHLFRGLAIEQETEAMAHQGQYPVMYLTFKEVKATDFQTCLRQIHDIITKEYERHASPALSLQTTREERQWQEILTQQADQATLMNSLSLLMSILRRVHKQRVIVLIDEYDAPIQAGYQYGYYDKIVIFIRNLLTAVFKDNTDLEKGVLTGILRIAKESIFSGLNNIDVFSLLRSEFHDKFGFTQAEVTELAHHYAISDTGPITLWYNGYRFGDTVIYNPWSILKFLDSADRRCRPYWINTSSNELVRDLILRSRPAFQEQLETLLAGESIRCALDENIALRDIHNMPEAAINLLVFSGYLTPVRFIDDPWRQVYDVAIPNREIHLFYEDSVRIWLNQQAESRRIETLQHSLLRGDIVTFGKILQDLVVAILSYHDTAGDEPERVYHAFVLGLLVHLQDRYRIRSNRESGYGRYDVMMFPLDVNASGFVFEFKKVDKEDDKTPQAAMKSALKQIQEKEYATELQAAGIRKITGIGIVVEGKRVWVESIGL